LGDVVGSRTDADVAQVQLLHQDLPVKAGEKDHFGLAGGARRGHHVHDLLLGDGQKVERIGLEVVRRGVEAEPG
jgi:hypothetical protein